MALSFKKKDQTPFIDQDDEDDDDDEFKEIPKKKK